MGRKKSYKKEEPRPKPAAAAPAPEAASAAEEGQLPVPAEGAAAHPDGDEADAGPAIVPQVITGRPEWAATAPARLEQAEEEAFWFVFALAVMGCSPSPLDAAAALVAAVLAGRMLRALWSVPSDVAPDDIGNARMMLFGIATLAAIYKATQQTMMAVAWMFVSILFFNSLHNVRAMVALALKGGKKKRREIENASK